MAAKDLADVPIIAAKSPAKVELEEGKTYYWCRCGRSKNQPFCDGSHEETNGITPLEFKAEKSGEAYLCRCKASGDKPFCDGTHQTLDGDPGDPIPDQEEDGSNPEPKSTKIEPHIERIHDLAENGLETRGPHGAVDAMGVPAHALPKWNDIQFLTAQLARKPLSEDDAVSTSVVIGPRARKPLTIDIPLFVTDMSYGALSPEAKIALARGAETAGTAIASGEGGMLPEEQAESSRYMFELGPAQYGWRPEVAENVQAFHFKAGQAAKTGLGGILPGDKVTDKIAEVRGIAPGEDAEAPATFADFETPKDFANFADDVRERSGGIPIGFKLSAQHIEDDIDFALAAGADYIILDGRGGGTGAAPLILRDHISVPTIAALARARAHLDKTVGREVTLVVTGGLRVPEDFAKALALGADAVALGNAAIQAVGCVGARMCHTNRCPSGVATQDPELRKRLDPQRSADRLARFFAASTTLIQTLARACGHASVAEFTASDLTTWNRDMAHLTGVEYAGVKRG